MYTIKEELYILIYLVGFGIYLFASLDIIELLFLKIKNKVLKIICDILFFVIQIYIIYLFSYNLMDGYIPIYFILFIYIGYLIYNKLCKVHFKKAISLILLTFKKIIQLFKRIIKPLFYSKAVKWLINREFRIIKKTLKFRKKEEKN